MGVYGHRDASPAQGVGGAGRGPGGGRPHVAPYLANISTLSVGERSAGGPEAGDQGVGGSAVLTGCLAAGQS